MPSLVENFEPRISPTNGCVFPQASPKSTNGYAHPSAASSGKGTVDIPSLSSYVSTPPPPKDLWDSDDVQYLEKVVCDIRIEVQRIDPKNGSYTGRMRAHWVFRTLNSGDRTEPRIRVPGIRTPTLQSFVEESRIWRVYHDDTDDTIAWHGMTETTFHGFEVFEVQDFPFDRQLVNLSLVEFVWRESKDSDVYYEGMKVVKLTMETVSMLPEWDTFQAVVEPLKVLKPGSGPSYCTRFNIKLRLQRKATYYILQIFMVSTLITLASLLPVALAPGHIHVGDRLSLHAGGLLTLVSFKYGIQSELPSVPYPTFVSSYMHSQLVTIVFVSAENIVAYKLVEENHVDKDRMNMVEDVLLYGVLMFWLIYFLYVFVSEVLGWKCWGKKRIPWVEVLANQDEDKTRMARSTS